MMEKVEGTVYSVHPAYDRMESFRRNMKERTGKELPEWVRILNKEGPTERREAVKWLKGEHGFTSNYADFVAQYRDGEAGIENYRPDQLVDAQYSAKKGHLRPIYDELLKLGFSLGKDVKACPCKTYVPLYRKNVFAHIIPATMKRVDLGLALGDEPFSERLIDTGGLKKGDRITHRIPIESVDDIDSFVTDAFRRAYDG